MNIENMVRRSIAAVDAYQEPVPKGIKLHANTNLFDENPALARVLKTIDTAQFRDYPEQQYGTLRQALARVHALDPERFVVGNGSDDLIDIILKTFINPGEKLVISEPTFSIFALSGAIHLADVVNVPLDARYQLRPKDVAAAGGKVTIVCRPNNPTGACFPLADVEAVVRMCAKKNGIVVVDEAYIEFVADEQGTARDLIDRYDNLIITRTFSKAYGLAGLRIGYAMTSSAIAAQLNKVKGPYNLNRFSEAVAIEALKNPRYVERIREKVVIQRQRLTEALEAMDITVFPSDINFVLAQLPCDSKNVTEALDARGFLVRDLGANPATRNCIRITVAPQTIQKAFITACKQALETCGDS